MPSTAKTLDCQHGVELCEVTMYGGNGEILLTTWIVGSERKARPQDVQLPGNFATLADAKQFFDEEVVRCSLKG